MSEVKETQQHPKVEIAVKNFGPIAEANIDLRPLTVFVGPSNTGKTYFATLFYALHGVFPGFAEPRLLIPSGFRWVVDLLEALKRFVLKKDPLSGKEKFRDILKKLSRSERAFKLSDLPAEIRDSLWDTIKDSETFGDNLQAALKNYFDIDSILSLRQLTKEQPNELAISLRIGVEHQDGWSIKMTTSKSDVVFDSSFNEDMILIPEGLAISTDWEGEGDFHFTLSGNWDWTPDSSVGTEGQFDSKSHNWIGGNRYYLPAARSGIMQSHRVITSSLVKRTTRVGLERFPEVPTMSGVIADFMERIILYEEKKISNDEMKHLSEILESDVLAGQILLKPSPSGYPDFHYRPQGIEEDIRLSQTSSMVSELAPLVLYLRSLVQPSDTLIIEEPEAHLHPGAQADMAVILARLVRAGVRVIITTHSDWLLQEISNLTLEGLLAEETDEPASWLLPDEVGVWHFQKDEPVKEIPFHSREGISPEDYEDVAEGLYNRSVNLQQRFEKKKGEDERESS